MRKMGWTEEGRQFASHVERKSVLAPKLVVDKAGHVILAKAQLDAAASEA